MTILGIPHARHCPDCETGRHCLAGARCEDCGKPMKAGVCPFNGYQAARSESWPAPTYYATRMTR